MVKNYYFKSSYSGKMIRFLRWNWIIRGDVVTPVCKIVLFYFIASKKSKNYHLLWFLVTIELNFNKKEESSDFFKYNFKVFLEKTNKEKYYVYFDENKKDKKEVSLNEIKETFNNVNKVESKKFSLSELEN